MMRIIFFAIGMLMGACAVTAFVCCRAGADAERRSLEDGAVRRR